MKLYAQYGSKPGNKIVEGLQQGLLDGVIVGAKDESASYQRDFMKRISTEFPDRQLLFDPQLYACFIATKDRARLGALWGDDSHGFEGGNGYFRPLRRRDLERESDAERELERCLVHQAKMPVQALIAPNIVIRRSLDSMEAAISKSFIRLAADRRDVVAPGMPVLATLAISVTALADRSEFLAFLDDVTMLDNPPDGFYLLVEHSEGAAPFTLTEPDMLARWMLLNRVLKVNGFEVVNGYSDILSPYLGAAGADAGASGWYGTLKAFSMERFEPLDKRGGRASARYTSMKLHKSIKWRELQTVSSICNGVWNELPTDRFFRNLGEDSEPSLEQQALQNWEAVRTMMSRLVSEEDVETSLGACRLALDDAAEAYALINERGMTLREKSNEEHISAIRDELDSFEKLAEL